MGGFEVRAWWMERRSGELLVLRSGSDVRSNG